MMPWEPVTLVILLLGAFAGGFATGIIGFGAAIISMVIWLTVIDPLLAVPVMTLCAVAAQLLSLKTVWHARNTGRIGVLLAAGILAVPLGAWLLTRADPATFKVGIGAALALYSAWRLLAARRSVRAQWRPGPVGTAAIGLLTGFLGGFTGIMAPVLTLWSSLQGWGKDEQRATYQPVMLALVLVMLASYAWQGLVTAEVAWLALAITPAILLGTLAGTAVYAHIDDRQFEMLILVTVLLAGLNLALKPLWG